ncbi:MAG: helix-turn-helix transcriptional regulator [Prolixibacteraceae bacterium]|nr:helix-turn-helix transcriptional regulator [Prolixibacteraceae bacterium]
MYKKSHKIELTLAIEHYLLRSGIQFIIKQLGLDVNYHHISNTEDIKKGIESDFMILHHKIIPKPKALNLKKLQEFYRGKVLLIGNETMHAELFDNVIYPSDKELDIIQKIEHFFSELKIKEPEENNEAISTREIEILKHVALGYSNKEIADKLFISINTVITHRKNLTEKLGIKTISGLTVYALMNNLIDANDVKP